MAAKPPERRNSNTLLLEELESLSQSLYQSHTRRTASLALPRTSAPSASTADPITKNEDKPERPRSRRLSLSPWRSRPKLETETETDKEKTEEPSIDNGRGSSGEKKGKIWNWKPIRALSHIGMQKLSCLFSVEIVAAEGLPSSMNGLRLSVCVRKKETKDGAVQTMPARVLQGAADFEEILFVRCHVYCSTVAGGSGKQVKFEPRPFLIYVFAVDAEELDFGRNCVDLSLLVQESVEKNVEGMRVRQWDKSFGLSGKAKGGKLAVKLGFQIMEKDGGLGIYSQAQGLKKGSKGGEGSSSFARKHSKSSFSVSSPRMSSRGAEASSPSNVGGAAGVDIHGMDELNLDEPSDPKPATSSSAPSSKEPIEPKMDDLDLPDFDVVDKGVEIQERPADSEKAESEGAFDEKSVSSEVVKEVVHDKVHLTRLTELDSIAKQIKALESMMEDGRSVKSEQETGSQRLDADEETVTREFLQMLEEEEEANKHLHWADSPRIKAKGAFKEGGAEGAESEVYLPDLGKGLGCVVQTKDGGYLAATNPFNVKVPRKETPKLAMQLSKPLILQLQKSLSGFEVFQKMAAIGPEELGSRILSFMPIDELVGKTAEQTAFEGIASAIIQGRNKEGASSSAARSVASLKAMSTAMIKGRKERIATGIWNVDEDPVPLDEILAFSMQKIEAMAVEALKIQADMAEEDAPFDVSPLVEKTVQDANNFPLASALPLEDWFKNGRPDTDTESIILSATLQLRDPLRRYESVGGPLIILVQAARAESSESKGEYDEECFKVLSLHVGCLRVRMRGKRNSWDSEKQRLTAMQWLVGYNLGKAGKKGKHAQATGPDCFWSMSSRIMADMWLKSMRNPDIKFTKKQ